jgi:hypothetical protein
MLTRDGCYSDSRQNIFFMVISPTPGTFVIALHFKGRDKPILEMDLKIDDLLEKVRGGLIGGEQQSWILC